jgi:hypothetical protein
MSDEDRPRTLRIDTYRDFDKIVQGIILIFDEKIQHFTWKKIGNNQRIRGYIKTEQEAIPCVYINVVVDETCNGITRTIYEYSSTSRYDINVTIRWIIANIEYTADVNDYELIENISSRPISVDKATTMLYPEQGRLTVEDGCKLISVAALERTIIKDMANIKLV